MAIEDKGETLWNWAVAGYGARGVREALLGLQDRFGAHVPLVLWAAHSATLGRAVPLEEAKSARASLASLSALTRSLRDARRRVGEVGAGEGEVAASAIGEAKAAIGQGELALEKLELLRLAARPAAVAAGAQGELLTANVEAALAAVGIDLHERAAAEASRTLVAALAHAFTA